MSKSMIEAGHFEAEGIRARTKVIESQWTELKEVSQARQDVSNLCFKCLVCALRDSARSIDQYSSAL